MSLGTKLDPIKYEENQHAMIDFVVNKEKEECDWSERKLRRFWERKPVHELIEAYSIRGGK